MGHNASLTPRLPSEQRARCSVFLQFQRKLQQSLNAFTKLQPWSNFATGTVYVRIIRSAIRTPAIHEGFPPRLAHAELAAGSQMGLEILGEAERAAQTATRHAAVSNPNANATW